MKETEAAGKADGRPLHGLALDDYDNVIGFIVSKTAHVLKRCLNEAFQQEEVGLHAREFPVLNRLHQYGALTQTELCELTYPDRPAMTRMLDRLIGLDLVQKKVAETDRRAFHVSLTAKGRDVHARAAAVVSGMLQIIAKGESEEDLETAIRMLRHLHDRAEAYETEMVMAARLREEAAAPRKRAALYTSKWAARPQEKSKP